MRRSNCLRSLCHVAIYQETICYYCCYYYHFLVKRMFSSIWLIWKVSAIRFSHCKQYLILTSFDIVPSASVHLNQIFCFYLYLNIKNVILLLNTNNLYKPQTFFLIRAILPLICWRAFLGDHHIHLTSEIHHIHLKYFTFNWKAAILSICCWKFLRFRHFERLIYLWF